MSKIIKNTFRNLKKIIKGTVNFIKKVAKSPIGKILLVAATVYFGGAALMGGLSGASAGTGFMGTLSGAVQGAATGVANAWTGLTGAASSAMSGNFAQAGSQLSAGFQGTTVAAGQGLSASAGGMTGLTPTTQAATTAGEAANYSLTGGAGGAGGGSGLTAGGTGLTGSGNVLAPTLDVAAKTASEGIISGAWNGLGPYGKMAAIQGGTQLAGGYLQGAGAEKAAREERDRYNTNVGTRIYNRETGAYETAGGGYGTQPASTYQSPVAPDLALIRDQRGLIASNIPQQNSAKYRG